MRTETTSSGNNFKLNFDNKDKHENKLNELENKVPLKKTKQELETKVIFFCFSSN